jgi:malate dehydrogenase (oxaloacetate-decarboxylating)
MGLGILAVKARRVSDKMFMAAAKALAEASPARLNKHATLLPPVSELREVALNVALATARQAHKEGLTDIAFDQIQAAVENKVWSPAYEQLTR